MNWKYLYIWPDLTKALIWIPHSKLYALLSCTIRTLCAGTCYLHGHPPPLSNTSEGVGCLSPAVWNNYIVIRIQTLLLPRPPPPLPSSSWNSTVYSILSNILDYTTKQSYFGIHGIHASNALTTSPRCNTLTAPYNGLKDSLYKTSFISPLHRSVYTAAYIQNRTKMNVNIIYTWEKKIPTCVLSDTQRRQ